MKLFVATTAISAVLMLASGARATPHLAQSADDFVDRIGVATHWGYPDTPYGFAYDKVSTLLGESGIRHIRDGLHPREADLFARFGIKTTVIVGPPRDPRESVKELEPIAETLAAIEGPNEVDIFPQSGTYGGKTFPEGARQFQDELYAAVKASPALKSLPVIAPSIARLDSNLKLAPLKSFDWLVMHSYAGGAMPSLSLSNETTDNLRNAPRIQAKNEEQKPIAVTESGYHTALKANITLGGVQAGISEEAHRKYLPRHFAEYFNAGITRTISYEFINEFADEATNAEASFGMVRRDLTPKPAYFAMKNLIALLSESKWNAATRQWSTPVVTPRALDFDILPANRAQPRDVHSTLLQKSDGSFYLLLWREASSFDTATGRDLEVQSAPVTISFKTKIASAQLWNLKSGAAPVQTWARTTAISLAVPDEIVALKINPLLPRAQIVNAPDEPKVEATGDSINLSWPPSEDATGYFVWQSGKYLGATPKPEWKLERLDPARGYRIKIQAHNGGLSVSPAREFVTFTKDVAPDLVVTSLTLEPANPKVGQAVSLRATLENRGDGPSTAGVTHGVAFFVGPTLIAWSDTFNKSLAPGEKTELIANSGPQGTATWTAAAGTHTLRALADDVNRINESDENNNARQIEVKVE